MKTLYVSDLDGTLITHRERISEYSLAVINGLMKKGLMFTYATARSLASAENAVTGLSHSLPVIVYNGALIVAPLTREALYSLTFPFKTKKMIVERLNDFDISPVVHARMGTEDKIIWRMGTESSGQLRYISRRKGDKRLLAVSEEEQLFDGDAYFLACNGSHETMRLVHDELEKLGIYSLIYPETYSSDYWLEILPRGATKANASLKLKELLGCDELVCFGDSANDSEMFDVCDRKYAVENADDWLKSKATGVIGYCEEDGVAKWLAENAFGSV